MSDYSEYIKPFLKAFDEACGKAFENGADIERERIIKLLKSKTIIYSVLTPEQLGEWEQMFNLMLGHTIELIKGETK